jgi:broad specificity phosphatase PhoE
MFQPPTSPLTEKGQEQAQMIAKRAARLYFDALISSPFTRARETAEAIARATEAGIEYSDLFVEPEA